mgnify:CR=1 FL=1
MECRSPKGDADEPPFPFTLRITAGRVRRQWRVDRGEEERAKEKESIWSLVQRSTIIAGHRINFPLGLRALSFTASAHTISF